MPVLRFIHQNLRWIAGGLLLTFMSSFGQTFFISGSVGDWQQKFGLSPGRFGFLYIVATIFSALTLPFIGKVVDVVPAHRVIAFEMVAAALAPSNTASPLACLERSGRKSMAACISAPFAPPLPLSASLPLRPGRA